MKTTLLAFALTIATTLAQGNLNPPSGGPTATMKTLDQLEARTPIPKSPAVPIAGLHYLIIQPGSYYLTGNITVASGDAIVINSDDVSLDLNGFTIKSIQTSGASGRAINVTSGLSNNRSRITVKNGSIVSGTVVINGTTPTPVGFLGGIGSNSQIKQAVISDIHVTGTSGSGIVIDAQGIIKHCTASNSGAIGLFADIVKDSSADNCYADGILAKTVSNCSGGSVNGSGIYCTGNVTNCYGSTNAPEASQFDLGIRCEGTATYCRASKPASGFVVGLALIAIGCTTDSENGRWTCPQKFLGTL